MPRIDISYRRKAVVATLLFGTQAALPFLPLYTIFLTESKGLSLGEVGLLEAVSSAAFIAAAAPLGWLIDKFSVKKGLISGYLLSAFAFTILIFARNMPEILVYSIAFGVGFTLLNGANASMLKSYVSNTDDPYRLWGGRVAIVQPVASVVAFTLGGYLGTVNEKLPFAVSAIMYLISAAVAFLLLTDVPNSPNDHPSFMSGIKAAAKNRELISAILCFSTTRTQSKAMVVYISPLLLATDVDARLIGASWAIYMLATWAGASIGQKWGLSQYSTHYRVGAAPFLVAALALVCGTYMTSAWLVILGFALNGIVRGWWSSIDVASVQDAADDRTQAQVFSSSLTVTQIMTAVVVMLVGFAGDVSDAALALALMPGVGILIGASLIRSYPKREVTVK